MALDKPSWLPSPELSGYGLQHVDTTMRTPMESGRARQRQRFTSAPTMATVSWVLTENQAGLFEGWFRWALKDGTEWVNLELKTPMGYKAYVCRFVGMYDGPEPFAFTDWRIQARVEIRDRQTYSRAWSTIGEQFIAGADIIDRAANKKWPAEPGIDLIDIAINQEWPLA